MKADAKKSKRKPVWFLIGLTLLLASLFVARTVLFWWFHPLLAYADQACYMATGELILQGKIPYIDFFDFNPPLIMYLNTIPVAVSNLCRIPIPLSFDLFIAFLMVFDFSIAALLFLIHRKHPDSIQYIPVLIAFLIFSQIQMADYGQREHLFYLGYFPFLIARYFSWEGRWVPRPLAILAGIAGGVGICLKPQFLPVAIGVELVQLLKYRNWKRFLRLENYACFATGLLYIAFFMLLPREARDEYIFNAVPIYKGGAEWYCTSLIYNLTNDEEWWRSAFMTLATVCLAGAFRTKSALLPPLGTFTMLSLVLYLGAGQHWLYHRVPMLGGAYLLWGVEFALLLNPIRKFLNKIWISDYILILPILAWFGFESYVHINEIVRPPEHAKLVDLKPFGYNGKENEFDFDPMAGAILKYSKRGDRVLFIGTGVNPGYPTILQTQRRQGSRFLHAMVLPMTEMGIFNLKEKDPDKAEKLREKERVTVDMFGADIETFKPTLVIVQDSPINWYFEPFHFYERFIHPHYRKVAQHEEWTVWQRKDNRENIDPDKEDNGSEDSLVVKKFEEDLLEQKKKRAEEAKRQEEQRKEEQRKFAEEAKKAVAEEAQRVKDEAERASKVETQKTAERDAAKAAEQKLKDEAKQKEEAKLAEQEAKNSELRKKQIEEEARRASEREFKAAEQRRAAEAKKAASNKH